MTRTAVATAQRSRDCVWSRPGIQLAGLGPDLQLESPWVCVRTGARLPISEAACEHCPHWQADDFRLADSARASRGVTDS
jgi:hypothetical protein